jgi:hypothetical protein
VRHSLAHLGSSGVGEGHQEHHRGPGPWVLEPDSLGHVSDELEGNINKLSRNSKPQQEQATTTQEETCNAMLPWKITLGLYLLVEVSAVSSASLNKRPFNVHVNSSRESLCGRTALRAIRVALNFTRNLAKCNFRESEARRSQTILCYPSTQGFIWFCN